MSTWFVFAQAMGIAAIFFDFISGFAVARIKNFYLSAAGSLLWVGMLIFIGIDTLFEDMLPVIIVAATVRSIGFWTPRKKRERVVFYAVLSAAIVLTAVSIMQASPQIRWGAAALLGSGLAFVAAGFLRKRHIYNLVALLYAVVLLLAQTPVYILEGQIRWNPVGILIEGMHIFSLFANYAFRLFSKIFADAQKTSLKQGDDD